ncbi:hypothetical protein UlMin_034873 [Ulmus minor]
MESSVASNSTPRTGLHHPPSLQPFTDRVVRALENHLRLLHRSDDTFFILGATGNVYTVTLTNTPFCTCPDRITPCKHILFVFIRVLGLPLDAPYFRKRSLRPCQLRRLLDLPTLPECMASPSVCRTFHRVFFESRNLGLNKRPDVEIEEGTACPVCLEEMGKEERVAICGTCRNPIHEECFSRWKRSSGRRSASCVICRARWRPERTADAGEYLNLSLYVNGWDDVLADCGG